jgi:predicted enzyme related to lactoylglutathione lyase
MMKSFVSIFEVPVVDFNRAKKFYENILNISIEETEMDGNRMGLFPGDPNAGSGVLIEGAGYKPSSEYGVLIYLNGGNDLQLILERIEPNKGQVIVPKTQISPEMGNFAIFIDSEGNKLGLHSMK